MPASSTSLTRKGSEFLVRHAAIALLVIASATSAVLLLAYQAHTTFFQDDFDFLIKRQHFSADSLLQPHDVHISVIPVAIYRGLIQVFGMGTAAPERVTNTVLLIAAAVVLFVYVRRRLGEWVALCAAVVILFFGSGWNVLLWDFELSYAGSVAAGLAMLLALDRRDERGDLLACLFLVVSIAFSSLGLPFAVAAVIDVWSRRDEGWQRRAYVAGVPLALYALWYAGYGHTAHSPLSLHNVGKTPLYVFDGLASSLDSLLGLNGRPIGAEGTAGPEWGRPLLVGLAFAVVAWIALGNRPSRRIWVVGAAALSFWTLAGFDFVPGREPESSRYQYVGAIFLILVLSELFAGARLGRRTTAAVGLVTVLALGSNLVLLGDGKTFMKQQSEVTRADLGALEIARGEVARDFRLSLATSGTPTLVDVSAGPYFSAIDAHGSPADTPAEIPLESETARNGADLVLAHGLGLRLAQSGTSIANGRTAPRVLTSAGVPVQSSRACVILPQGTGGRTVGIRLLPPGTSIHLAPGPPSSMALRRFSTDSYPYRLAELPGATVARLAIPRDRSSMPWQLSVDATQRVTLCGGG
jgi:hypothetical protein